MNSRLPRGDRFNFGMYPAMKTRLSTTGVQIAVMNGEGEIRTHGPFQDIRFQVGRNRPLCHLSNLAIRI